MAEKQETTADILAEMRGARTEFPFVYLMGEPDTPEVIDLRTKEITEPRKINIRRVTVKELVDRFEAALKRESGNYAAMREALKATLDLFWDIHNANRSPQSNQAYAVIRKIKAALAAPPRNCDTPYNDRVEMYGAFKDWCNARGHTMEPKLAYDAFDWLLATATKKEGGAK